MTVRSDNILFVVGSIVLYCSGKACCRLSVVCCRRCDVAGRCRATSRRRASCWCRTTWRYRRPPPTRARSCTCSSSSSASYSASPSASAPSSSAPPTITRHTFRWFYHIFTYNGPHNIHNKSIKSGRVLRNELYYWQSDIGCRSIDSILYSGMVSFWHYELFDKPLVELGTLRIMKVKTQLSNEWNV